jgi:hypothetical protein
LLEKIKILLYLSNTRLTAKKIKRGIFPGGSVRVRTLAHHSAIALFFSGKAIVSVYLGRKI